MSLAVYLSAAWFFTGVAITCTSGTQRQELAFLLLLFVILNTHFYTIFDDILSRISISKKPLLFTDYLIFRSVIVPAILTGCVMLFRGSKNWLGLIAGPIVAAAADYGTASLKIITYTAWSPLHAAVYYGLLEMAALILLAGFRRLRDIDA